MGMVHKYELGKSDSLLVKTGNHASRIALKLRATPKNKKVTYWSAAVLAFLIAPIAALSLSAKPDTQANLVAPNSSLNNVEGTGVAIPETEQTLGNGSVTTSDSQNTNSGNVSSVVFGSVNVNGQEIEVPQNGNVNKTVVDENGQATHININTNTSTTGSGDSQRSNSTLRVRTNSDSNIRIHQ